MFGTLDAVPLGFVCAGINCQLADRPAVVKRSTRPDELVGNDGFWEYRGRAGTRRGRNMNLGSRRWTVRCGAPGLGAGLAGRHAVFRGALRPEEQPPFSDAVRGDAYQVHVKSAVCFHYRHRLTALSTHIMS